MSSIVEEEEAKKVELAQQLKDEGNVLLQSHKYSQAAEKYSEAIAIMPTAIFYANRAQALLKLESYGLAISDANEAIKLDPKYIKAYYRRGSANMALGKLKMALKDFQAVTSISPKDQDAKNKLKACEKAIVQEAFKKAIVSDSDNGSVEENIDFDSITVESSYDGPHLSSDGVVTMSFVRELLDHFKSQKLLHRKYVLKILHDVRDYLKNIPSLMRLYLPVLPDGSLGHFNVCGDTHGQYYDLCNIFEVGGLPTDENPFLFNGDFVDRGSFSFEVVFILLTIKLAAPQALFLLRGNHETKNMNKIYGFEGEVLHKYDITVMNLFSEIFSWLPLAAVIQDAVFVVHGGLSTINDGRFSLADVEAIGRGCEPPESGLMSDLLWSGK